MAACSCSSRFACLSVPACLIVLLSSVFLLAPLRLLRCARASSAIQGATRYHCAPVSTPTRASSGAFSTSSVSGSISAPAPGTHKGTRAHRSLTGQRVHDRLTRLGDPPSPARASPASATAP